MSLDKLDTHELACALAPKNVYSQRHPQGTLLFAVDFADEFEAFLECGILAHGFVRLLKRVFAIAVEHCPQCGGALKIIAAIEEPAVIAKILTHLGLPARAPPRPLALFRAA